MKFIHVSDLHLDRPFEGLTIVPATLEQKLVQNAKEVLQNILSVIKKEKADAIFIVGDTFHQAHIAYDMQQLWVYFLEQCLELKVQPFVIFGNHDYYDPSRYWIPWPDDVIAWYSEDVETKYWTTSANERLAISSFSYCHPHIQVNKIDDFTSRDPKVDYHIGLYHGQMTGSYAPFQVEKMKQRQYHYWALGHIHRYQELEHNVIYPGTPQGKKRGEWNEGRIVIGELFQNDCHILKVNVAPIVYELKEQYLENQTLPQLIDDIKDNLSAEHYTVVDWQLFISESGSDIVEEELNSRDFDEYLHSGIALGDTGAIIHFEKKKVGEVTELLSPSLQEELQNNYRRDDVFMSVGDVLFHDVTLADDVPILLEEKNELIAEAFESFKDDLMEGDL